mmetsp:Transcript_27832/g.28278  ORF Transcript_27832/g.28278 Transcript_27832/m.28278 type:complete len:166 (-) Transcript_27832:488-985(-)
MLRILIILMVAIMVYCTNAKKFIQSSSAFITNNSGRKQIYSHRQKYHRMQSPSDIIVDQIWTLEDLEEFAHKQGVELSKTSMGPAFRTVARSTQNSSKILGYGEGFVRPAGNILHLDKMEVYKPIVKQVRRENPDFSGGGTIFGVGLLFGYQCLLHGALVGFEIK